MIDRTDFLLTLLTSYTVDRLRGTSIGRYITLLCVFV